MVVYRITLKEGRIKPLDYVIFGINCRWLQMEGELRTGGDYRVNHISSIF
jgi:hypothetical protein